MINDNDILAELPDGSTIKFIDFLKDPYSLRKVPDIFYLTTTGVSVYRICLSLIPLYGYSNAVLAELQDKKKSGEITITKEVVLQ